MRHGSETTEGMSAMDRVVSTVPVYLSLRPGASVELHQFPLSARPLDVPPSALVAGKKIRARTKQTALRTEIHVPLDPRPHLFNHDKSNEYARARTEQDESIPIPASSASPAPSSHSQTGRLSELRLRSERVQPKGSYMIGILNNDALHLHPVHHVLQFKPTLDYLDHLSRRSSRRSQPSPDSDSEFDETIEDTEGSNQLQSSAKKDKRASEPKQVTVVAKRTDEKNTVQLGGDLSSARRDMLTALRREEEEPWKELQYCGSDSIESADIRTQLTTSTTAKLTCKLTALDLLQ